MALEELAHVSGADLGGGGGGGGRRRSRHFRQRIHGTSFPKVAGVHVPIGDGVYTSLIPIQPQTSTFHQVTPEALPEFHR